MKKSIFLFFAAILCAIGMNAAQVTPNGKYFYFKTSSTWNVDGPRYAVYFAWRNGGGEDKTWASCKTVPGTTDILYVTAPGEFWDIYFCRMNGSTTDNKDANVWNKTDKLQYDGSKNFWTKSTGWNGTTTYSTYVPAISSVTLSDNGTSIISGTGTQADPYLVYVETTIKVKGAGTKVLDDPDAKLNYNFKQGTTSKQEGTSATYQFTASATADTEYTINLDGYTKVNTTKSTVPKSATALYYKTVERAEETNTVTISYKCGDKDVQTGITEVVGVSTTSSFTAPTNITGYKFTNWTIGAGIDLKAGTASDATITVVTKSASSDYTLVANYEEVLETIYFINTGKWNVVNLHRWNGTATATAWPGEAMTSTGEKIGEYDVYSFTAQQGAFANVIFTNKNTGSDQTDDLTWTAGKYYIYNYGGKSGWYTKAEAEELLVVPVVTHDIVVKAVVPEAWTSTTIGIHYWGDGISATSTPVATEKDGNWNKYTIKNVPEGVSVNVIFLNGTSWPDDKSKQTANITGITEDKCFQISAKTLDGEGKCTFTEVDCAADIKPEGDVYTIMGAGELGLSWDLTKTGNDMTKQADGTYTLVKEGLDLATTGNYEYKVVKNHSWDWSIPSGNTNQTLKVDKDGTYTVTFTLSADKTKLTADAECTAEKEVILDCFVAGTTNLVGGTTDFTDELPMTYDKGTKTYSKTFTALAAGNYQMKVVYGSDWLGYDKLTKPVPANVTEGDDKKIKFSLAEAGDVTVTYHVENGIGLVGTFAAPAPEAKKYYVKGTHNEWTADATSEMTLDGEVYKKEVTLAKDVEFKINDGADAWWGKDNLGGKSYNELEGLESGNLKMIEAKTFTIIFKPAEHLITFEGLTEKAPAEPAKCYLMGIGGDWTTGIEMEEDGDQFKLLRQPIAEGEQFKFKYGDTWSTEVENYEANGVNWVETSPESGQYNITLPAGNYDFYYKKTSNQVYIAKVEAPAVQSGKFSTGKYEYAEFAPGNLQYHTSNGTWHFAQNQYDYVGEANINVGDPNYKGWIDMFGWSADGKFGVNPSNKNEDYTGEFQDWGTKMGEGWSTLSADQWKYLLNTRPKATDLKQIARVGDVVGIMLFPDNWSKAQEVQAELDSYFNVNIYNYTTTQWTDLEAAGAIFLPAAGRRTGGYGNMINKDQVEETDPANLNGGHYKHQDNTNIYCYYWTSTINESTKDVSYLHNIQALGGDKYTIGTGAVWGEKGRYGQSVRLAKVTSTLIEIGDGDNSTVITDNAGKTVNVQVNRSFTANVGYYTICLPFDLAAEKIGKALQISSITENIAEQGMNVVFTEVTNLVAGQPYLVLPSEDLTNPIFENVEIVNTTGKTTATVTGAGINITFTGIINGVGEQTNGTTQYYVGNNGYLYNKPTAKLGLRAFFTITDAAGQEVKNIRARVVTREDAATGFENITNGEDTTIKVIENGQLIIIRNGEKFNAQGQKL